MSSAYEDHEDHAFRLIINDVVLFQRTADLREDLNTQAQNSDHLYDALEGLRGALEGHRVELEGIRGENRRLNEAFIELQQRRDDGGGCNVFEMGLIFTLALGVLLAGGEVVSPTLWCLSVCVAGRMIQILRPRVVAAMAAMADRVDQLVEAHRCCCAAALVTYGW